jgi:putative transposase
LNGTTSRRKNRCIEPCCAIGSSNNGEGFVESFNGRLRDECLNEHLFANLHHARALIGAWRDDDNHHRPHSSLDGLTLWEYHQRSRENQTLNRANQ